MAKDKDNKHIFLDDVQWGNQETDSVSHDDMLEINWNKKLTKARKEKQAISLSKTTLENEANVYEYKYVVHSPGKDLLYIYDKHATVKNKTFLPSTIYHYRYEHEYPNFNDLNDRYNTYIKPGKNDYLKERLSYVFESSANAYYVNSINRKYPWLTTAKSKSYEFDNLLEVRKFFDEHLGININVYEQDLEKEHIINEYCKLIGNHGGWVVLRKKK